MNEITPYVTPSILSGNLRQMGQQIRSYKIKLVGQSEIEVSATSIAPAILGFLNIPLNEKIGFLQRIALTQDDTPIYYLENYISVELANQLTKKELEGNSLIQLLEKKCGLEFEKAKMIMTFSNPLGDVVRNLACSESEPLIRMQISSYLKNAEPVQITLIYIKAENFYYQVDLNYGLTWVLSGWWHGAFARIQGVRTEDAWAVELIAGREGLIRRKLLLDKSVLVNRGPLFILPLGMLIFMLIKGFSVGLTGFFVIWFLFIYNPVFLLQPGTTLTNGLLSVLAAALCFVMAGSVLYKFMIYPLRLPGQILLTLGFVACFWFCVTLNIAMFIFGVCIGGVVVVMQLRHGSKGLAPISA